MLRECMPSPEYGTSRTADMAIPLSSFCSIEVAIVMQYSQFSRCIRRTQRAEPPAQYTQPMLTMHCPHIADPVRMPRGLGQRE